MIARRVRAVAAVSAVSLVVLTGCSSSKSTPKQQAASSSSPSASAADKCQPSTDGSDEFGKKAKIDIPAGNPSGKLDVTVKIEGKGAKVADKDIVVLHFTGKLWQGGCYLGSSYDVDPSTGAPKAVTMQEGQANGVLPGWQEALLGKTAGSRVEVVVPPDKGFGAGGRPADANFPVTIKGTDSMVFDLDVIGVYPNLAPSVPNGPNLPIDASLPQVAPWVAPDAANPKDPKVTIPSAKPAPTALVAKPVIKGRGPEVKTGQTVVMQYTGMLWKDGSVFDSSWTKSKSPFSTSIGIGAVVKGWDEGLVGQTVGSRVLLVIPPDKGYGAAGQGPISGTDTMVFVVDILDAA